jgi:hypothetical protein
MFQRSRPAGVLPTDTPNSLRATTIAIDIFGKRPQGVSVDEASWPDRMKFQFYHFELKRLIQLDYYLEIFKPGATLG